MPMKPRANPRPRHMELSLRVSAAGAERGALGPVCARAMQGEGHALGLGPSKHDLGQVTFLPWASPVATINWVKTNNFFHLPVP